MSRSKKLIAFMGGMIDEEKNCYFIHSMEEECINDQYGHAEGDFAIQSIAGAIHHIASRNGISARYGGDDKRS